MTRITLYAAIFTLALSACDGTSIPSTSSNGSVSSSSQASTQLTQSEQAFKQTLYPFLNANCAVCHNSSGAKIIPLHSDSNITQAHSAALTVVKLDAPQASRIISRLRDDHHNCPGDCSAAASSVQKAIENWATIVNGGNVDLAACDVSFPQDLILLGELPFVKSLQSLMGKNIAEGRVQPDAAIKLFSQKGNIANTSLVRIRLDWADLATTNFKRKAIQASGCLMADNNCARTYIEKFATRGFKRPVSSEEIDELMTVFEQGAKTSFVHGLKLATQAVVFSASFNHRTEYGDRNNDGTYSLTPYELAASLSYFLTDTLPDDELFAAAKSGALSNPAEREAQVDRLLAKPETKEAIEYTLLSAWNMGNLFGKVKDPETFPEYSAGLAAQMYQETRLFLRKHLWTGGINKLLSSRTTFVTDALADLYGIPFPGSDPYEFVEVEITDGNRAGILTQPSVLTAFSRTDETSVVARGLLVNGPMLCMARIPPPPEEALAVIGEQLMSDATQQELADFRAANSPCKDCHNQFDAYGLLFENYDAIGRYRATDESGMNITSDIDLSKMASFDEVVSGVVDFGELLAGRSDFTECVTRHMVAYSTGSDAIQRSQCEVTNITQNLNPDSSLTDIIKALVKSPTLSLRTAETSQ